MIHGANQYRPEERIMVTICNLMFVLTLPIQDRGAPPAAAKPAEQRLSDALRDVINKGADLYNPPNRDHNGCYRLFQGALMAVRPQLENQPGLQKEIDTALSEAERQGPDGQRAFTLRKALDRIRETINPKGAPKPEEKKSEGTTDPMKPGEPKPPSG
jgi:hypothetical protein